MTLLEKGSRDLRADLGDSFGVEGEIMHRHVGIDKSHSSYHSLVKSLRPYLENFHGLQTCQPSIKRYLDLIFVNRES